MRSIRLSLVVYFLVLLAAALGAVCWFVYETASKTLREKEASTRQLIENQCKADTERLKETLDKRIFSQAGTLASLAQSTSTHFEGLYPLGMLGVASMPQGHLLIPLWLAEGTHPYLFVKLQRKRTLDFQIDSADALIPEPDEHQPQEFFQVFRASGKSVVHSDGVDPKDLSVGDRKIAEKGLWENAEIRPGIAVRRVTLSALVPSFKSTSLTFMWRWGPEKKGFFARKPPQPPPRLSPFGGFDVPTIFVQYGSETNLMEKQIRSLEENRDRGLENLHKDTQASLAELRLRLFLISISTFIAILVGGFFLVRLGLAPLARLGEAVSKVSAQDFRLKIDEDSLPEELKPIAGRLSHTLSELKKAFAREKQAAADISHELRTPLAALLTTLELALRKPRTAQEYRDLLQECRGSGEHMMYLVERIMALARLDAGADRVRPRRVDIAELATQCAEMVRPLAEARGIDLTVSAPTPMPLQIDPDKVREVLTNLLHNAIEYNRPKGTIALRVERENGHVLMAVRDTGIGISPEVREHIFERFYRADPSRHSEGPHAGLGLSIVKSYVELLGGQIDVTSDATGSCFRVQVPAIEPAEEGIAALS